MLFRSLTVIAHLKDYDPALEISASVTFFDRQVDELLPELKAPERQPGKLNRDGQAQNSQP